MPPAELCRTGRPHSIRHSLAVKSVSRKASRRSFGWSGFACRARAGWRSGAAQFSSSNAMARTATCRTWSAGPSARRRRGQRHHAPGPSPRIYACLQPEQGMVAPSAQPVRWRQSQRCRQQRIDLCVPRDIGLGAVDARADVDGRHLCSRIEVGDSARTRARRSIAAPRMHNDRGAALPISLPASS